jgi:signal transduction histidine kinase/CheY-like chemotaxis protein
VPAPPRQSLLWKYTAYWGGLVSVLLIASGAIGGYFAYREAVAALHGIQQTRAHFAASEIETFMSRLQDSLHGIVAKLETMGPLEPEHIRIELIALLRYHPEVSDLRWADGNGRARLALSRYGMEAAQADRNGGDPRNAGDAHGNHVGPVYFRQETEPYVNVAAVSAASRHLLEADVNLRYVWDVVSQAQPTPHGVTYVVDARGQLISHPDASLVFAKTDMSGLPQVQRALTSGAGAVPNGEPARDLKGLTVVSTAAPIERLHWLVFAEQPLDDAFRPVYASVVRSIALVLIGVAAAVAASLLLARRMVRPIREIEMRARQLGEGQFEQRIDVRGSDELGALALQFNRMAGRLHDMNASQEARIADRTRDLSVANEAKTRFVAAASHDLRQPIHALALFVGELRASELPADAATLTGRIESSVESLEALLDALLDLSKLDIGAIEPKPRAFALQELLARLAQQFGPVAQVKGVAVVHVRTSLWVRSDPLLLERIFLNLISNALHHTHRGRIVIGCRRRGDSVEAMVADTGVGIEARHLPRIFEEFYRAAPSGDDRHVGLGLGLAIVKRIGLLLGHRITIDSVVGKGTVARVLLPLAAPPPPARATVMTEPKLDVADPLHGLRILVIDDEAQAREAMRGLLTRWGCEVETAAGGEEAMGLARRQPPDVVLCDLRLAGDERGTDVVHAVKRMCPATVSFAFVTGESEAELIAEARSKGHVLLFKPTSPAKLRAAVEHLVRSSSQEVPASSP